MTNAFHGVYLLYSVSVKYRGKVYIGYTVNPTRRISQHNKGAKFGGAARTNNKGPWEMALIVYGFPNDVSALRFEWAWQNPLQSRRLNHLGRKKTGETWLHYHLRLLNAMIGSSPWKRLPLIIHNLNNEIVSMEQGVLSNLPDHMEVLSGPLNPPENVAIISKNSPVCGLCHNESDVESVSCYKEKCTFEVHIICLAEHFLKGTDHILPVIGKCPSCLESITWGRLVGGTA